MAVALAGLALLQFVLLSWAAKASPGRAARAVARSFIPLQALWPLFLLVSLWDPANHIFVYYPGVGLYWGGIAFIFAIVQLALVPVQLDGPTQLRAWLWRSMTGLRGASLRGPYAFPAVLLAYASLRVSILFSFDLAKRLDAGPPFEQAYALGTLTDQGVYPYLQRWSEYPPGLPWLSSGVYRAVSFFGVDYGRYYVAMTLTLFLFGVGSLVLLYKIADALWDRPRAVRAAALYAVLVMPAHEMLRVFEELPVFFLLLTTYLLVVNRRHAGALALALGALVKIVPLAVGPALLRYAGGWREAGRIVTIAAVVGAGVLTPLRWFGGPWFDASFANMLARPPWETVWALLDGFYGPGGAPDYRMNPVTATAYDHVGRLPAWFWPLLPLALAVFYLTVLRRAPRQDARGRVALTLLCVVAFTLANKGFSPQFILWIVPFVLILSPTGRGLTLVLGLTLLEQFRWGIHLALGWPLWWMALTVSVRTAALIGIGVWAYRLAWPRATGEMPPRGAAAAGIPAGAPPAQSL
ncbi:MAG: hypothetical protein FJ029_06010 [Actinobacteria bacterium]|nr:hypothetical protein [Actinomycetota bacterium]